MFLYFLYTPYVSQIPSVMTDLSVPVYTIIKNTVNGDFQGKEYRFGLAENAIKTTNFTYTKDIIGKEKLKKLEEIKEMIKNGKIKVQR